MPSFQSAPIETNEKFVLAVDDDPSLRALLSSTLSPICKVIAVASVAESVEVAKRLPPTAVIMDYAMPEATGIDGLKQLRQLYPELPVVILTGHADLDVAREAIQIGAVEYMLKPFDAGDLITVVTQFLESAQVRQSAEPATSGQARRTVPTVDLWRGRMPTVPSENRMEAILDGGQRLEAKMLRINRDVVQAEIYDPTATIEHGQAVEKLSAWVGSEIAYTGPAWLSNVIDTGVTRICEFTLLSDWLFRTEKSTPTGVSLKEMSAAFRERWQERSRISPAFQLAVANVSALLIELRDWLDGLELTDAGKISDDATGYVHMRQLFDEVRPAMDAAFGKFEVEAALVPASDVGVYAEHVRSMWHPLILTAPFVHRSFTKPLMYPGDFGVMNYMLGNPFEGGSLFSRILNAWAIESGACAAYRHRVNYLGTALQEEVNRVKNRQGGTCRVLSLGCGAAPEVQRFIQSDALSDNANFTLLDFNPITTQYARDQLAAAQAKAERQVNLAVHEYSVQQMLAQGTRLLNQPHIPRSGLLERGSYDLLYCAGLFDYLSDRVCKRLLEIFWELAAPGALIVASNFAPANPRKGFMDYALDWRLIHRDEAEVLNLAVDEAHNSQPTLFHAPDSVEIFLRMRKPDAAEPDGKAAS